MSTKSDTGNSKLTHLFAIYPVRSISPTLDASSWILDTGTKSHVTGQRSSITSDFVAYAPGERAPGEVGYKAVFDVAGIGTAIIQTGKLR